MSEIPVAEIQLTCWAAFRNKSCYRSSVSAYQSMINTENLHCINRVETKTIRFQRSRTKPFEASRHKQYMWSPRQDPGASPPTWKWRMMVQIRPRVSLGLPSTISSDRMFTKRICKPANSGSRVAAKRHVTGQQDHIVTAF